MDEFVPIPDCDGYFINKNGEVLSKKRKNHIIKKNEKIKMVIIWLVLLKIIKKKDPVVCTDC
jgi:hypothetical protein